MGRARKNKSKWISVESRLPEKSDKNDHSKDVLLYIPPREGCRQSGIFIGHLREIASEDHINKLFGDMVYGSEWCVWNWGYFEKPVPTHWMKLPKKPIGGVVS